MEPGGDWYTWTELLWNFGESSRSTQVPCEFPPSVFFPLIDFQYFFHLLILKETRRNLWYLWVTVHGPTTNAFSFALRKFNIEPENDRLVQMIFLCKRGVFSGSLWIFWVYTSWYEESTIIYSLFLKIYLRWCTFLFRISCIKRSRW